MVMRFDPFQEFDRWAQQMSSGPRPRRMSVPLDAYRRGDRVVACFDMPGTDLNSIELSCESNVLSVSAERELEHQEGDQLFVHERPEGGYFRQIFVGEALDLDRVEASYDRGVLRITIPVAETAKPRRIQVKTTEQPTELPGLPELPELPAP